MALLSQENCDFTAQAISEAVEDGSAPSWNQNNVDWYKAGMIDCQTLVNATGWQLQQAIIDTGSFTDIFQEILQDRNLIDLGLAQIDQSRALAEANAIREAQRMADQEAIAERNRLQQEFNDLVSGQLVNLGEASVDASEAIKNTADSSFFGDLLTGALGGSSIIILLVILFMIKK